jgi:hypothetical protein
MLPLKGIPEAEFLKKQNSIQRLASEFSKDFSVLGLAYEFLSPSFCWLFTNVGQAS